jgi:hypothetical protein
MTAPIAAAAISAPRRKAKVMVIELERNVMAGSF